MAEINENPDLKKEFDAQMLGSTMFFGQFSLLQLINPFFFGDNGGILRLHILSHRGDLHFSSSLTIGSIGRAKSFPIFGM